MSWADDLPRSSFGAAKFSFRGGRPNSRLRRMRSGPRARTAERRLLPLFRRAFADVTIEGQETKRNSQTEAPDSGSGEPEDLRKRSKRASPKKRAIGAPCTTMDGRRDFYAVLRPACIVGHDVTRGPHARIAIQTPHRSARSRPDDHDMPSFSSVDDQLRRAGLFPPRLWGRAFFQANRGLTKWRLHFLPFLAAC
jgi:hypothetical protein